MSAGGRTRATTAYRWVSWVPAGSWIALDRYVDRYDGWGAWAAAPVLLVPIVLSLVLLAPGAYVVWRERAVGRVTVGTAAAFVLASLPTLWAVWRFVVLSLG